MLCLTWKFMLLCWRLFSFVFPSSTWISTQLLEFAWGSATIRLHCQKTLHTPSYNPWISMHIQPTILGGWRGWRRETMFIQVVVVRSRVRCSCQSRRGWSWTNHSWHGEIPPASLRKRTYHKWKTKFQLKAFDERFPGHDFVELCSCSQRLCLCLPVVSRSIFGWVATVRKK